MSNTHNNVSIGRFVQESELLHARSSGVHSWHSRLDWCREQFGRGKFLRQGSADLLWFLCLVAISLSFALVNKDVLLWFTGSLGLHWAVRGGIYILGVRPVAGVTWGVLGLVEEIG